MTFHRTDKTLWGLAIACAAVWFYWLASHSGPLLWDFKTYHAAGKAFLAGLDPYSITDLSLVAGEPLSFPFVYPPHTLWLFTLYALPSYSTSVLLFLTLKAAAFVVLLFLWNKEFLRDLATPFFILFSLFAFNTSVYLDFETGNMSVFEQLGLWFAFSLLLRRRLAGFAAVLLLIGSFKLVPLAFLLLPLLLDHPRRRKVVSISLAVSAILAAGTFLFSPRLSAGFVQNLTTSPGTGIVNPSLFQFFDDGRAYIERSVGVGAPIWLPEMFFIVCAVLIIALAAKALGVLRRSDSAEKELLVVLFLCVVFALLLPRFKNYSYILLLVPSWYVLHRSTLIRFPALFAFLVMVPFHPPVAGYGILSALWEFYPLAVTCFVFFLFLHHIVHLSHDSGARGSLPTT